MTEIKENISRPSNGVQTASTPGGFFRVSGTEARVCEMIAARQRLGMVKYGTTVEGNPLELRQWLVHALEEMLDQSVYLARAIEELDKQRDDGK